MKENYGLEKDLSMNLILMLFSIPDGYVGDVVELVNKSEEKNVKLYTIEGEQDSLPHYSRDDLIRYAVISVIGSSIVGKKVANRARNELKTKHRRLMRDVINAVKNKDYQKAFNLLKSTESEVINDVLMAVDYKDVPTSNILRAVESKNPLDYDSRVQLACCFLPRSYEILKYCKDEKIVLIRYDLGSQTIGSAICYWEGDTFVVDSVEGHRRLRNQSILRIVYKDLVKRAKENGAKRIIFNKDVGNETPRNFIAYLSRIGLKEREVKMRWDTKCHLEAGRGGVVRGYVIEL